MDDPLTRLRLSFPTEVTGAFLAAQKLLNGPDGKSPQNYDFYMGAFVIALLMINVLIYTRIYKVRSLWFLIYISAGFLLWVFAIDSARLGDLLGFDSYPIMPMMLILYTVVSTLVPLPSVQKPDAAARGAA